MAGNVKLLKTIREFLTNYYIMKRSIFILISLLCSLLYRTETLAQSKFSDYCLYKDTMDVDLYCINVFSLEEYNVQERNFGHIIDIMVDNDYIGHFYQTKYEQGLQRNLVNFLKCPDLECNRLLLFPPFDSYWSDIVQGSYSEVPNFRKLPKEYYYTDKSRTYGAWIYRIKGKAIRAAVRSEFLATNEAYKYFSSRTQKQVGESVPAFYLYIMLSCDVEMYTSDAICDKKNGLKRVKVYQN